MRLLAIGFRSKTARAIGVALGGTPAKPALLWRGEIALADPGEPATSQPYHEVMELPWEESLVAVRPLVERVEAAATASLAALLEQLCGKPRCIAVVGANDRPLRSLGNVHIRAHAAEGILFRRVIEVAAGRLGLECRGWSEKELPSNARVAAAVQSLGQAAGPPWRADEKAAAAAALLAMA